jgi:hypothetical protein
MKSSTVIRFATLITLYSRTATAQWTWTFYPDLDCIGDAENITGSGEQSCTNPPSNLVSFKFVSNGETLGLYFNSSDNPSDGSCVGTPEEFSSSSMCFNMDEGGEVITSGGDVIAAGQDVTKYFIQ